MNQPPSGGCVLKLDIFVQPFGETTQPPSGGCVLKRQQSVYLNKRQSQPPSGGCVLKQSSFLNGLKTDDPAAFRRLCVETLQTKRHLCE